MPLADEARDVDRAWRPAYAVWELTLKCDLACAHCGSRAGRTRPEELDTAECMDLVAQMVQPRSEVPSPTQPARFGLGIWLHPTRDLVELHGSDAGVSFQTTHDRSEPFTYTVLSNTTDGAWPIVVHLDEFFHW